MTIKEVTKMFDISADTLRCYERNSRSRAHRKRHTQLHRGGPRMDKDRHMLPQCGHAG